VTYGQAGAVCPKCGSAAAVQTIAEWAAMAQGRMAQQWQPGAPMPGFPAGPGPQPGFPAGPGPQAGFPAGPGPQPGFPAGPGPQPGFPDPSQYQQSGFPDPSQYQRPPSPAEPPPAQQPGYPAGSPPAQQPGYQAGSPPAQQPGYQAGSPPAQQPGYQAGFPPAEPWQNQPPPRRTGGWDGISDATSFEEGIADAVLGAATKAIGRAIGSRMRRAYNERVVPAMAARQEAMLRQRTAIAERHPDLRACLNDQVVFLAGGTRVLPLANALAVRAVEQSDALVAQLRG
jgi:hypothetical protein